MAPQRTNHPRFQERRFVCNAGSTALCRRGFLTLGSLRQHRTAIHPVLTHHHNVQPILPALAADLIPPFYQHAYVEDAPDEGDPIAPMPPLAQHVSLTHHPVLDGVPVDADGNDLPPDTLPPPYANSADAAWSPFTDRSQFELADFLFRQDQMPETHIDNLLGLWASSQKAGDEPPFRNHTHLHSIIDSVTHGDLPWQSFSVQYTGALPEGEAPPWMLAHYDVWFRDPRGLVLNQLANPDFKDEIDYSPVQIFDRDGKRVWTHFMTGNWTWRQANEIAKDPATHGAMLVPIILGSDKTTVSVATGQTEYYPLYISNGNIHNNVRQAHRNAVSLVGFLAIPKTDREYSGNATFRKFRMTTPEIVRCPDGHLRRAVYALGPYIADYPEQVMLACVVSGWCPRCGADHNDLDAGGSPRSHARTRLLMDTYDVKTLWEDHGIIDDVLPFTSHFPRADIHELLSFDILHQVIKGTFKDHLVTWVEDYIKLVHTAADAAAIIADIDQRIAAAPAFPGLRWFIMKH
ncbi:hypothetical protein EW146_g9372 [Bondarzewia mesenterica]|uniref:C2H2-type domain-containing protein n=1 Tax=Bondarzewia mesenterica TaxID=1095465 RepID=A0A4S4L8E2_9AGAM|nr:hypothetical protein EW146_g9372 [Bondarzewia mesenterica]